MCSYLAVSSTSSSIGLNRAKCSRARCGDPHTSLGSSLSCKQQKNNSQRPRQVDARMGDQLIGHPAPVFNDAGASNASNLQAGAGVSAGAAAAC